MTDAKYPVNVARIDGHWGCDGHAKDPGEAVECFLSIFGADCAPPDFRKHGIRATLVDLDLLDGELDTQTLSRSRIEEAYGDEIDNLGARLYRGSGRWHLFVECWEVGLFDMD